MTRLTGSLKLLAAVAALATCGARADVCTTEQESAALAYSVGSLGFDSCATLYPESHGVATYSCEDDCLLFYEAMVDVVSDCELASDGVNLATVASDLTALCGGSVGSTASTSGSSEATEASATSEDASSSTEAPDTTETSTSGVSSASAEGSSTTSAASESAEASASSTGWSSASAATAAPSSSSSGSASDNAATSLAIGASVATAAAALAFVAL